MAPAPDGRSVLLDAPSHLTGAAAMWCTRVVRPSDRWLGVWEFFGGGAFVNPVNPSMRRFDAVPRVGLGGQPGFEHLERPGTMSKSRGGATSRSDGRQVQDDGDEFVAVRVWRHTYHPRHDTRTPRNRAGSLISRRPSARTAVFSGLPGAPRAQGDTRHRQMVGRSQPSECPVHCRP